ncbi:MAG: insulinase family protein, partial [Bacteroidetes bacterium]|nr:insulinase family protein [Bacteroidota bacterium]
QTAIGTVEHLKNPSLTKMYEFFKTYYVANNMVLVLSGDFNSGDAKKFIEKSWGDLPTGKIPTLKGVNTDPFESAKLIEAKLSPIKVGGLGFHTVPMGHKDQLALEIFHAMLSNSSQSGLLDKLQIDNKIMGAGVIPIDYLDAGATLLFFIPKIIGQKHADAEKLIMDEIGKIKSGAFDDWMLEAAKTALYVDHQKSLENNESVVLSLVNAELSGQDLGGFFTKGEAIRKVSKEEIMQVAKKYYGDNHLSFYSSTGFPAKAKIQKPEYEPVVSKNEGSSEYGKQLMAIQSGELNITPLNYKQDVKQLPFSERSFFYHTLNPKNDIFSLNIKFRIGTDVEPMAEHVATMMNYAGTDKLDAKALKDEFAKLGISCGIAAEKTYFTIQLEGLEENFSKALPLVNALLQNPSLPQDKMSTLYDLAKSDRKLEKSQPEQLAQALFSYLRYENESPYLKRLTLKQIKNLESTAIIEKYKEYQTYNVEIHYVGQLPAEEIKTQLEDAIAWNNNPKFGLVPYYKKVKNYTENQVFLVNKKNVNQSQVYFMINPFYFEPEQKSNMDAFNMYFGGGFSGLVVQEIREYRSLAYSAGAQVYAPASNEFPCQFYGMLGTQADKTLDAIEVFNGLIREMPVKEERLEMIKEFLVNEAQTDVPNFRDRSAYIVKMQDMGYHTDPRIELVERYKDLTFEDILNYYEMVFREEPLIIAIAGDKKRIDVKELEKYGKVTVLKPKQLLSK